MKFASGTRVKGEIALRAVKFGPAGQVKVFFEFFWVLRTLRYQWQSCGQLRKYGNGAPGKGLRPFHSRDFLKKIE